MNSERVSDHYPDAKDFEALLKGAEDADPRAKDADFVADIRARYDKWGQGMFLSRKQLGWLKRVAGEKDDD